MSRFSYGSRSHVGLVRQNNEDAAFAGPYLQLVADGVGGAAAGEVASATTAYVVSAMAAGTRADDLVEMLSSAVQESHRQLRRGVAEDPTRSGMATTLTALVAHESRFAVAHIGDSRAYLQREGRLVRLTTDHTLVQTLVDEGQITPEAVATHPYRSVVLRSVEADQPPEPDIGWVDLGAGDRVLLCSDGLSDLVPEGHIHALLGTADPDAAATALLRAALDAGGRDNVTCLVADVQDGPAVCPDGTLLGALGDPYLVVDPTAVRPVRLA